VGESVGVALEVGLSVGVGDELGVAVGESVKLPVGLAVGVALGVALGVAVGVALGVAVKVPVALGLAVGVGVDDWISTELESAQLLATAQSPYWSVPCAMALKLTVPGKSVSKTQVKERAPPAAALPLTGSGPLKRPTAPEPVAVRPWGVTLSAEAPP
jgi:hypothetical protein